MPNYFTFISKLKSNNNNKIDVKIIYQSNDLTNKFIDTYT